MPEDEVSFVHNLFESLNSKSSIDITHGLIKAITLVSFDLIWSAKSTHAFHYTGFLVLKSPLLESLSSSFSQFLEVKTISMKKKQKQSNEPTMR